MRPLITTFSGRPCGHVPGHSWLDADLVVERRRKRGSRPACYVATITVSAGSAQETHGRNDTTYWCRVYTAIGVDAVSAIRNARDEALDGEEDDADLCGYIRTAASEALREAA